jgi:ketosteroid isomerase-like protein
MASANVEVVRSILAANARGDYSSTDWADPAIEFVIADGPSPGAWKGVSGMAAGWRELASAWRDFRTQAEEFRVLDDERILVLINRTARGKTSGVQLDETLTRGAGLFHVCGGKVTRVVVYFNRDQALIDLGLSPEAGSAGPR